MAYLNILIINLFIFFVASTSNKNEIPSENYNINFKIKNAGSNVSGNLKGLNLKYEFDKNKLNNSFFEGSVEVLSIKTGIDMRDRHLQKSEFFDAAKFPRIHLKTDKIELISENLYNLTCSLTIKGLTKSLVLPAKITNSRNKLEIDSEFELSRLDFGLGKPSVVMSKNVKVILNLKLNKIEN
jgi:polyisoprenoid-binding protein YceI